MKTQNTLFTDSEIKKYSQTEKLNILLSSIVNCLQVTEKSKKKFAKNISYYGTTPGYTTFFANYDLTNKDNIKNEFTDMSVNITEEMITIEGPDFCYQFVPEQILTVQNRIKKINN